MITKTVKHHRWRVTSRVFAATVLGFVLTHTFSVMLSLILPMPKLEAVLMVSIASFLIFAIIVLWIFSIDSLWKVYGYLLGAIAVTGLSAWYLQSLEVIA